MSGITIALFLVTKQTAVLLTGGALLLCALVGIFVLTQVFGKRLSQFTADLCQTFDHMIAGNEAPQRPEDSLSLIHIYGPDRCVHARCVAAACQYSNGFH